MTRPLILCLIVALAAAACSPMSLRNDTRAYPWVDDRRLMVSWIEMEPDVFDLVVEDATDPDDPPSPPLELDTAQKAAEIIANRHCLFHQVTQLPPAVARPGDRYSFQYRCGD